MTCHFHFHFYFHFEEDDASTLWNQVTLSGLKFTVKVLWGSPPQMFPSPENFIKGAFPLLTLLSSTFDKFSQQNLLSSPQNDNNKLRKVKQITFQIKFHETFAERTVSIDFHPQPVLTTKFLEYIQPWSQKFEENLFNILRKFVLHFQIFFTF